MKRLILALALACACAQAQTTVAETGVVTMPGGGLATGTIAIVPTAAFVSATGVLVERRPITVQVTNGTFSVALYPNDTADPANTLYLVEYSLRYATCPSCRSLTRQETWSVPTSGTPVTIASVVFTGGGGAALPVQAGQTGKSLITDGSAASWVRRIIPGFGASGSDYVWDPLSGVHLSRPDENETLSANVVRDMSAGRWEPPQVAFASLPAAVVGNEGWVFVVTDCLALPCVAGGGTTRAWLRSTGSAWETIGGGSSTYRTVFAANANNDTVAAASTEYGALNGSSVFGGLENFKTSPMPRSGTIKNLYLVTLSAQPATGTMVCTVRIDGVNSAVAVTIAASAVAGTFSDTVNAAAVTAGQGVSIGCANNAPANASANIGGYSLEVEF